MQNLKQNFIRSYRNLQTQLRIKTQSTNHIKIKVDFHPLLNFYV